MRAIRFVRHGGPEVLEPAVVEPRPPAPGEVLVRHEAIGLNFIDVYQRTGLYTSPLPAIPGREAAGRVAAVGDGVDRLRVGDRVAYATELGAYAEMNTVRAARCVRLPDDIPAEIAAASMLKGMTAEFLARRIWPVGAGDTVLVHAAAGGVGSILCQWLASRGVRVIGTTGSAAKAVFARAHGCAEVILYREEDVVERVRSLTNRDGVKVVYDSVGRATFEVSLKSLRPRGVLVSFGNASGPVEPVAPLRLGEGSLFLTRPRLFDYIASAAELDASASALFEAIRSGAVRIEVGQTFPLERAADAHRALEGRATTGATLLIP
jgi:NADPH2:quinone reductase